MRNDSGPESREKNTPDGEAPSSRASRWLWFIGLYCAGLAAMALVAWFFRALLGLD